MVTNRTYLNNIKQIAQLFSGNDVISQAGIESRLKTYFNDQTFPGFLAHLNNRMFYVGWYDLPMIKLPNGQYRTYFNFMDLITGKTGKGMSPMFPVTIYNPNDTDWQKVIENTNKPYLNFIDIIGNKILFSSNEFGGYGIAYTTTQPQTTGGQTTTQQTGGGYIVVTQPANATGGTPSPVPGGVVNESSFDYQSLIIPGAIVLAAYLILK